MVPVPKLLFCEQKGVPAACPDYFGSGGDPAPACPARAGCGNGGGTLAADKASALRVEILKNIRLKPSQNLLRPLPSGRGQLTTIQIALGIHFNCPGF